MVLNLDNLVDFVHLSADILGSIFSAYKTITLLQFPHASLFSLGANAINGATTVFANNVGKPKLYWLHSLILVIITAFGGGTMAPLLIGKPSMIVANDQIIFLCAVAWYATHNLGLQPFLTSLPVRLVWTFFLGLFRTHSVVNVVIVATSVLSATIYYPIPLIGPIVVGTALGSMGMFLPFDKGFAPIKNCTPWNMQGALLTAAFFHLMVHDKTGFLGVSLRSVVGTYDAGTVKMIIATAQILSLELQVLFNPDANLFAPLHKVLYLLLQVQGPIAATSSVTKTSVGWNIALRNRLSHLVELCRVGLLVSVAVAYIRFNVPRHSLRASPDHLMMVGTTTYESGEVVPSSIQLLSPAAPSSLQALVAMNIRQQLVAPDRLRVGESLGSCQYFHAIRSCEPHLMRLELGGLGLCGHPGASNATSADAGDSAADSCSATYRIAVYKGTEFVSGEPAVWVHDLPPRSLSADEVGQRAENEPEGAEVSLMLASGGQIHLVSGAPSTASPNLSVPLKVLWSSEQRYCGNITATGGAAGFKVDHLLHKPVVGCSDGTTVSF